MRVLIYGVNTQNKGAQLLLAATAERLRSWGCVPVVSARDVSAHTRAEFGARGMFSVERLGRLRSLGLGLVPRRADGLLPVIADGRFDYVLDASGFSLTDSWGMAPVSSRLSRLRRWSARGIGFTMLPQAFGPFARPDVSAGVRDIVDYADAIWARDQKSFDYVKGLDGKVSPGIAPDITIGLSVEPSTQAQDKVVLVPNWNLANRSGGDGRERYVASLTAIARELIVSGMDVVGMSHEGEADLALIRQVASGIKGMEVLNPQSGVECKRIISGSRMVIAGRYHALVSALSSGVPVVGHSWSHKYSALMNDFGVVDSLADPLSPEETIERVRLIDEMSERARLRRSHDEVVSRTEAVWEQVASALAAR